MRRLVAVGLTSLTLAACAPHVPRIERPASITAFCGSRQARGTSIESILASTDDRIAEPYARYEAIVRDLRANGGAIAYYPDQPVFLPNIAPTLGESGKYARVDAVAIPTPPVDDPAAHGEPSRPIYMQVRDHGIKRWIGMTAFDVQNVCVEGTHQN